MIISEEKLKETDTYRRLSPLVRRFNEIVDDIVEDGGLFPLIQCLKRLYGEVKPARVLSPDKARDFIRDILSDRGWDDKRGCPWITHPVLVEIASRRPFEGISAYWLEEMREFTVNVEHELPTENTIEVVYHMALDSLPDTPAPTVVFRIEMYETKINDNTKEITVNERFSENQLTALH